MPFAIPLSIPSSRLTIRPIEERDLEAVFKCYNHHDVMRYCPPTRWGTLENARKWLVRIRQRVAEGNAMQFVIELKGPATVIGTCVLFKIDEGSLRAEIGYALGRDFWGAGYIHEALSALIDYTFNTMSLHRLEAEIDPRNEASARSLLRLGFVLEGTLRERWIDEDEVSDAGLYGLLARDWFARKDKN
ncbi:GNAT family N-acetyltransferase [Undibacterium terreum]|uniref:N-acetyltransferase n=1 Tax=Undibacterium terreum TaxID=1224302 RepID=A0A916XBX5_9BURK|nr:GNAT family N-acetyltransferase [Undibacterium terreum]GGC62249.1 N-acetyltransferase [Undibacterium terreum]